MLPAARSKVHASREVPLCSPELSGNIKDIIILYEEDAEEWALYLLEVFSHVVSREGILLYNLESFSLQHLELMSLNFYNCKLLILSNSLLKDLTPKKCQFLETLLHSPESVVTLLCGVKTSDQLYQLLNISESKWEISTAQEPEDYISVIESVLFKDTEDYLEVITATDSGVSSTGHMSQRKETEDLPEASISTVPLAVVVPTEIPCENPGEIFIILRDEVLAETVEVEFWSDHMRIRTRPAVWNTKVWCLRALDFPAGLVNVDVYCDGIIKATREIKYYTTEKAAQCTSRVPDPRASLCQNDVEELDDALASVFKHEIPYYEFWPLQTKPYPQEQYTHFEQLPTLLHCAAKFGLKRLAIHLLQCSGATWASQMKNKEGSDPACIAERCGHEELKKIFEEFAIQEINRINDEESDYEEDFISFSKCSLTSENPASHHESRTHEPSADGAQANRTTGSKHENESDVETQRRPSETGSESSENHYDDLYAVIPDVEPENNLPVSHMSDRPPLPPPRPRTMTAAFQLERPHCTLQGKMESQMERNQNWCDAGVRKEIGAEFKEEEETEEDGPGRQEEEDPYIFAEIDDSEYDTILANMSIKKKSGSRSFIINRPPAPTPRPTHIPPKEETTPYIAQVFQQKAARRQSDGDKLHGPTKKQDRARVESPAFSTLSGCLAAEQEELILLQEKVKNGKMSMDEALEKFKLWQMGKSGLEMIQQEKLRQLRDLIVGKRPEDENTCDKLNIVHHPSGNEVLHNEKLLYSIPFSNKLPARLHVEKEFGFCCRKDH
ncbi:B-cell scaffold protein with ankyrin repeats isoform X2 [Ochotona curzoniae]|uniref:B-cell scaffold protein with ankyrin repeats isoform X2 n=1 Tax=Ochotona curzoniae TaxID=130825 RepID=UPI001B345BC8|nr:B-cell scaffold protein with ankyrin repeats isoform X2 [Ochotona curzoniae]